MVGCVEDVVEIEIHLHGDEDEGESEHRTENPREELRRFLGSEKECLQRGVFHGLYAEGMVAEDVCVGVEGGDDDTGFSLLGDFQDQLPRELGVLGIEVGEGFIEHEPLKGFGQCAQNGNSLLLSEGKLPARLHEFVFDLQLMGPLLNGVDCGDGLFGVLSDVLGELNVLKGGEAREQSQVLKNEARARRPPV